MKGKSKFQKELTLDIKKWDYSIIENSTVRLYVQSELERLFKMFPKTVDALDTRDVNTLRNNSQERLGFLLCYSKLAINISPPTLKFLLRSDQISFEFSISIDNNNWTINSFLYLSEIKITSIISYLKYAVCKISYKSIVFMSIDSIKCLDENVLFAAIERLNSQNKNNTAEYAHFNHKTISLKKDFNSSNCSIVVNVSKLFEYFNNPSSKPPFDCTTKMGIILESMVKDYHKEMNLEDDMSNNITHQGNDGSDDGWYELERTEKKLLINNITW